jgi:hypothetical protein
MVTGTIKLGRLIDWHLMYEIVSEDNEVHIYYYPTENVLVKIRLDPASIAVLKQKRDQIISLLNQTVTLSGEVLERWEKKQVTKPAETVEQWVQV